MEPVVIQVGLLNDRLYPLVDDGVDAGANPFEPVLDAMAKETGFEGPCHRGKGERRAPQSRRSLRFVVSGDEVGGFGGEAT